MNLIDCYKNAIDNGEIHDDSLQRKLLVELAQLSDSLTKPNGWFSWLQKNTIKGMYIYGSVGVGKTFLMDMFYENVAITQKSRLHFHAFMQQIDAKLRRLQGTKNPIQQIATEIAKSTRLLCFDEFMVDDVAYAMILSDLLQAMFAKGVILVVTSNIPPDELYKTGVQRARFLPAINAIKSHCNVINLTIKQDYRLDRGPKINTYITPLGPKAYQQLVQQFDTLSHGTPSNHGDLTIQNRQIPYFKCSAQLVWFEFRVICNLPRSQLDYLEIANRFDTIIVSGVPALGENDTLSTILLINFIDVMYDQGIRLILSAAVPIEQLYRSGEMTQPFKRTQSRLQEMQAEDYLRRHQRRKL